MSLSKVTYTDGTTVISAQNMNDIQDSIQALEGDNVSFTKRTYTDGETVITAENLNAIQDAIISLESNPPGIDTSDATATADDIADGKTAYVNGELITGSIKTIANGVGTPSYSVSDIFMKYTGNGKYILKNGSSLYCSSSNFGDATAEDVAAGKTFTSAAGLCVTGTHECSGGSSTNNCEAYHITTTTDTISFQGSGTVKVWGYGYYNSGSFGGTKYSFVGDGYYSASGWNSPTKTDSTFSINEDGTLSGLPSDITDIDLLVTIGI